MQIVRTAILTLSAIGFVACSSAATSGPTDRAQQTSTGSVGDDITLVPGGTVEVSSANLRIRFEKVAQDSRCPTNALILCVWEGSAQAQLTVSRINAAGETPIALETAGSPKNATVYGQLVTLVRVDPAKLTTDPIAANDYRSVIRIGAAK